MADTITPRTNPLPHQNDDMTTQPSPSSLPEATNDSPRPSLWRDMRLWVALSVLAVDQLVKAGMKQAVFMPASPISLTSFFTLTPVWNHGIGFGLLKQYQQGGVYLLIAIALLLSLLVWRWSSQQRQSLARLAAALVIGGAIGNVVDRLRFGAVMDFLDFHWQGYHWPAFNIADAAITIGVALLLLASVKSPATSPPAQVD
ncbi:MAG: signal peptidase II [Alphaproteobacteria bacterium]|nr:signal peptidase II [Alphaproteobacteria bacterium]